MDTAAPVLGSIDSDGFAVIRLTKGQAKFLYDHASASVQVGLQKLNKGDYTDKDEARHIVALIEEFKTLRDILSPCVPKPGDIT